MAQSKTPLPCSPTIICAENIALLHLLHRVPRPPSINQRDDVLHRTQVYSLSVEEERRLVTTLAFLSYVKDDPDHVPAVCAGQHIGSCTLNIFIAVNRVSAKDGVQSLQKCKNGFEELFATLTRVEIQEAAKNSKYDVHATVVSMCSERILCRLRLAQNAQGRTNQRTRELLQNATKYLNSGNRRKVAHAAQFIEMAKRVIHLMDLWIKHQVQARLVELVEGVFYLSQLNGLRDLVNAIPNKEMDPSSRTSLLNIVHKVARYWEAGRCLFRMAKKIHCVRHMKAIIVTLPDEAFQRYPAGDYSPELQQTVSRVDIQKQVTLSSICRILGLSTQAACDTFAQQVRKTLAEAKIHAEIQVLYFCEREPSLLRPRVICSSKDACFLCNAFIVAHGKVRVPRSHGRLYPAWRLPCMYGLVQTEQEFNRALEVQIRVSIREMTQKQRKTLYPFPNESTLLTLDQSMSTIPTCWEAGIQVAPGESAINRSETLASPCISTLSSQGNGRQNLAETSREVIDDAVKTSRSSDACVATILSTKAQTGGLGLEQDSLIMGTLHDSARQVFMDVGTLRVQIDLPTACLSTLHKGFELDYSLERLPNRKSEKCLGASIIDVDGLKDDMIVKLDDSNCLYLNYHDLVIKICLRLARTGLVESGAGAGS